MRTPRTFVYSLFCLGLLAGCGNPFGGQSSQIDTGHYPGGNSPPATAIAPARGSDFISSSGQFLLTDSGRFRVSSSLGSLTSNVYSVTPNQTQVYSNVQGILASDMEAQ